MARADFQGTFGKQARALALIAAGLGEFLPDLSMEEFWNFEPDFPELPRLLLPKQWSLVRRGVWVHQEHIVILEAMGLN